MTIAENEISPPYDIKGKDDNQACIIVFGNEKGGSGKSTTAMHVAVALLKIGYQVGTIDLDARQGTFTRYMRNRFKFITKSKMPIISPIHMAINKSEAPTLEARVKEENDFLEMAIAELGNKCDFIIIDTPGFDTNLSRIAHSYADVLITPMNDSFVDMALLAEIDPDTYEVGAPSIYSNMVNEARNIKMARDGVVFDWIVMRNRLSHINAKNKEDVGNVLERISFLAGFRTVSGFGERVIFRELFPKGLTLLDLEEEKDNEMTMSKISARQEVRNLIMAIKPERYKKIKKSVRAAVR